MATKIRTKNPESRLIVEAMKPYQIDKIDKILEKLSLSNPIERTVSRNQILSSKPLIPMPLPTVQASSNSPQGHSVLEALLAKHTRRFRPPDPPRLQNRPKTVSSLKSKKDILIQSNDIQDKTDKLNDEILTEPIPHSVTISCKKDPIIVGKYEIGDEIGKGAYGTVKIGVNTANNEKVAIKIYEKAGLLNPTRKKNVEREIKILNKLNHPNIIRVINTIETSSAINIVLEYISGCSLSDYLKSRSSRRIEEYQAKGVFKQILLALEFCHNLGITHRDIKLENILLDHEHTVKIIDFGFATYIANDKKVQLFCGTSCYMAPEIVTNKESLGPPTDIWAAGVVLYVLITGTFPFKAPQTKELYSKIQRGMYVIPPTMSSQAREVIKGVFEIDPHKRPTATQLLAYQWMNNGMDKTSSLKSRNLAGISPLFNKTFC
ncbi:hypothetical protein SteCoe_29401 [Stentor coeruleus]|uniref:Protein kinase domain-containing protein n=1 Tax=Stentor coeruleus TaxID=5963 RepID=A0A1R2B656_9CILI|nr:hypothetical protein SteCoe_29401 [Stentor coeruleus]